MTEFLRRTWAEIDLDCLSQNISAIQSRLSPGCKMMGVVKADAYGHGDKQAALEMERDGVDWFGVSNIEEGVGLRRAGITRPILIFGATPAEKAGILADFGITQALFSPDYAQDLSREAEKAGVEVEVHVKVDTGMSRIGFLWAGSPQHTAQEIARACALPRLRATGIFTHFAAADERSSQARAFTQAQFDRFMGVIQDLEGLGVAFPLRHCCNSAGLLAYPQMHLDMVRPGIICYGLSPSQELEGELPLRQVMRLRSVVSMVKEAPAGATVSYGRQFSCTQPTRIATLPIGYADGYSRLLGGKGRVLLSGREAPVIGRVCMDQIMVDVTHLPQVAAGDVATLLGPAPDGGEISINEVGTMCGTIGYEVVCLIGRRVPRVYLRDGKPVAVVDYVQGGITPPPE